MSNFPADSKQQRPKPSKRQSGYPQEHIAHLSGRADNRDLLPSAVTLSTTSSDSFSIDHRQAFSDNKDPAEVVSHASSMSESCVSFDAFSPDLVRAIPLSALSHQQLPSSLSHAVIYWDEKDSDIIGTVKSTLSNDSKTLRIFLNLQVKKQDDNNANNNDNKNIPQLRMPSENNPVATTGTLTDAQDGSLPFENWVEFEDLFEYPLQSKMASISTNKAVKSLHKDDFFWKTQDDEVQEDWIDPEADHQQSHGHSGDHSPSSGYEETSAPNENTKPKARLDTIWAHVLKQSAHTTTQDPPNSSPEPLSSYFCEPSMGVVMVTNAKKVQACSIVLSGLRLSPGLVAMSIDTLDESALTYEQLICLEPFVPTFEEQVAMQNSSPPLPPAALDSRSSTGSQLMIKLLAIPHAKRKMEALLFKKRFPVLVKKMTRAMQVIREVCHEIKNSSALQLVLGEVLQICRQSNQLSDLMQTTGTGGLRVASLWKLKRLTVNGRSSLLNDAVSRAYQRDPLLADHLKTELSVLARIRDLDQWESIQAKFQRMEDTVSFITNLAEDEAVRTSTDEEGKKMDFCEDKTLALQNTSLGRYALDAREQIALLQREIEDSHHAMISVINYFDEGRASVPYEILIHIVIFARDLQTAAFAYGPAYSVTSQPVSKRCIL